MIPNLAVVQLQSVGGRVHQLWIPVFLLWLPVIVLSPLILLVLISVCLAGKINPWRAIAVLWGLLSSLPGLNVHVSGQGSKVVVRVL